jgi:acetyl/propionyl-CoA carboxylase alpha subunit
MSQSWLWQVEEDNSTRPLNWNDEDDLEFDPYGESSKGLAEIMEAEKRRVVNGVRESLRNEQQYAEKEQQSAQQEQPYSQEEHVPLWRRRGSNAEATIQSHAQAHAQAAQAQAHAQAQAAQAQAQTHALNQINQAQAEAAQAQAAQAQAAQAQCLPQSHMPGQVKAMWLVVYGGWCASGIALLLQSVQDDN